MPIKHTFTSGKSDGGDSSLLQPSYWNADHTDDAGLLARGRVDRGGNLGTATNATPVTLSAAYLQLTFTTPASGAVDLVLKGFGILASGYTPYWCIYEGVTLVAEWTAGFFGGGNQSGYRVFRTHHTGLTAGSHTWTWKNRTDGGGSFSVGSDYCTAEMEIWAA